MSPAFGEGSAVRTIVTMDGNGRLAIDLRHQSSESAFDAVARSEQCRSVSGKVRKSGKTGFQKVRKSGNQG